MVVALERVEAIRIEDNSWRTPGCGERCRAVSAKFLGRTWWERIVLHDLHQHEAFGQHVLAREDAILVGDVVRTGNLEIDGPRGIVSVDGSPVYLTPREYAMLAFLARRLGLLCSQTEILRAIWGPEYVPELYDPSIQRSPEAHLLRVNFSRLRSKLGSARGLIETLPARGYRLRDVPPVDDGGGRR